MILTLSVTLTPGQSANSFYMTLPSKNTIYLQTKTVLRQNVIYGPCSRNSIALVHEHFEHQRAVVIHRNSKATGDLTLVLKDLTLTTKSAIYR